ncbi:hypothetical protein D3C71_1665270 [compost metagenome]
MQLHELFALAVQAQVAPLRWVDQLLAQFQDQLLFQLRRGIQLRGGLAFLFPRLQHAVHTQQQLGVFLPRFATDAAVARCGIALQVDDEAVAVHFRRQRQQLGVLAAFAHQSY